MPVFYGLGGAAEAGGMNTDDKRVYEQARAERQNLSWFRTPPPPPPLESPERVELIRRVMAEREAWIQQAKRNWLIHVQEEKREHELLSRIPDAEETLWSLEMREHARMAYRTKTRKEKKYGSSSDGSPRSLPTRYYNL